MEDYGVQLGLDLHVKEQLLNNITKREFRFGWRQEAENVRRRSWPKLINSCG